MLVFDRSVEAEVQSVPAIAYLRVQVGYPQSLHVSVYVNIGLGLPEHYYYDGFSMLTEQIEKTLYSLGPEVVLNGITKGVGVT